MAEQTKNEINYRFSGYQFLKIQLDDTFYYDIIIGVHPYYKYQPMYWQKPAYSANWAELGPKSSGGQVNQVTPVTTFGKEYKGESNSSTSYLHSMLKF